MNGRRSAAGGGSSIMKVTVCWVATTALICVPAPAPADDSVIDRVRACVTEADDAERLACYDFAIGRSKPGQNEDLGVTGELLRQRQRQAAPPASPPQEMSGKIVAISKRPYGKFVVTLDNGQVWAQSEVLDFSLELGDVVTIRRGVLGALWMVKGNHHAQTRVERIK
jgi:hypothetical protein